MTNNFFPDSLFDMNTSPAGKVYTVLEINTIVRDLIKQKFPSAVWICAEIQGLRPERDKAHTYFELVQKHEQGDEIIAKVRAALFANRKPDILKRIKEAGAQFELKNDIEVKLLCEVSVHAPTGQYSLVVIDIDPVYTLGKIAQNRQRIIEDLRKRNLLEKNRTLSLAMVPLRIGLITAFDSAAYHDFIHELSLRGYGFFVIAYNCHMQGKNTEHDVCSALNYFNARELDAIMLTRGGGSTSDLSAFDNKNIAEAIAFSKQPVLTALGHQIDQTVADLVAHTSLKTPTKGAQFLVERIQKFLEEVYVLGESIAKESIEVVQGNSDCLARLSMTIEKNTKEFFETHKEELLTHKLALLNAAKAVATKEANTMSLFQARLETHINKVFKKFTDEVKYAEQKIRLLDPKEVLKRGYSITRVSGKSIQSIEDVAVGDMLETVIYRGRIQSEVKERIHEQETDKIQ